MLRLRLIAASALAAAAAGATPAAADCGDFRTKLACHMHPLQCRWSRPHRDCVPKAPAPAPPTPPAPPAPPAPPGPSPSPAPGPRGNRSALFWLEPYANLTTVADYRTAWQQFSTNARPGYIMAGSAYALKPNGSLGYADTAAGEGLEGELMERAGFPALQQMGLRTIAMVYVTHEGAIRAMLQNPAPFIAALLAKAKAVGLAGFDVDYEPQAEAPGGTLSEGLRASFMDFLGQLASTLAKNGLTLTIDVGGCPTFNGFQCSGARGMAGLTQANCMHTFGSRSLSEFKQLASGDMQGLGEKWAPGFEPGNMKEGSGAAFKQILDYLREEGVSTLSTWEVHESNVGPQPQWLFDSVNSFLDGPDALKSDDAAGSEWRPRRRGAGEPDKGCTELATQVWWTSEGHRPNTTVLAMGSSLCYVDTINVCDGDAEHINGPPYTGASNCSTAKILGTSESSLQFVLPGSSGDAPKKKVFQVCNPYAAGGTPCSPFYSLNRPSLWWSQGDQSSGEAAASSSGGWLRMYGRSLGWTEAGDCAAATVDQPSPAAGTSAKLDAGGKSYALDVQASSCYHTELAVPATVPSGEYSLSVTTALGSAAGLANVTVVGPRAWPTKVVTVAPGANVSAALAQANGVAGGAIVSLGAGVHEMGDGEVLLLGDNVRLQGGTLRWAANSGKGPTASLIGAAPSVGKTGRYALENLTIAVDSPCQFVIDVSGHGTIVRGVTVTMPHTLANSGSVIHATGTAFEITGCNLTHDNIACTGAGYGYPRDCKMRDTFSICRGLVSLTRKASLLQACSTSSPGPTVDLCRATPSRWAAARS